METFNMKDKQYPTYQVDKKKRKGSSMKKKRRSKSKSRATAAKAASGGSCKPCENNEMMGGGIDMNPEREQLKNLENQMKNV